jgi:hypothetical protein
MTLVKQQPGPPNPDGQIASTDKIRVLEGRWDFRQDYIVELRLTTQQYATQISVPALLQIIPKLKTHLILHSSIRP